MSKRQPNFIVIVADDLGYGDIGCDGGTLIRTPNLDQMAAEGVRFTDFYASANVCTPSRAGLLTGRYAIRSGLAHEVIQPADTTGLPLSEVTIPKALGDAYATALIGKWHLGHVAPHWPPTAHGFDRFYGLPYSHDMRPLSLYAGEGASVEVVEERPDLARLTQYFFEQTLAFAEQNRDRPFFALVTLTAPHIPLKPNPDDLTGSPGGAYGEVVEEIDVNIGRQRPLVRGLVRSVPRPQGRVCLGRRLPRALHRPPAGNPAGRRRDRRAFQQPRSPADAAGHGRDRAAGRP